GYFVIPDHEVAESGKGTIIIRCPGTALDVHISPRKDYVRAGQTVYRAAAYRHILRYLLYSSYLGGQGGNLGLKGCYVCSRSLRSHWTLRTSIHLDEAYGIGNNDLAFFTVITKHDGNGVARGKLHRITIHPFTR